jgi:undecaprenyl diphosphate synthase
MKKEPQIDLKHVAIIMDGNRRWARAKGLPELEGHRQGVKRAEELIQTCADMEIPCLSLWAFSTENWKRDPEEVGALMGLLEYYLKHSGKKLHKKGVRLVHLGRKDRLPPALAQLLKDTEELTAANKTLRLQLCIDYGGRDEILRAVRKACETGKTDWTEADFSLILDTAGSADPDLIIRTSGEQRLSGFLPWQSVYSEFSFTDTCFPDFTPEVFEKILKDYQVRNRSLGK